MTESPATPPGWYYAQGDPPGTQRYWDGTQWQGGPQPVLDRPDGLSFTAAFDHATKGSRFVAYLIDGGLFLIAYIVLIIVIVFASMISDVLGAAIIMVGALSLFVAAGYNYLYLQGTTGQTFGKRQQGIKVVSQQTRQPIGVPMMLVRYIVISIFSIPFSLDHWWILVDENGQRLSDKQLGNVVVKV